MDHEKLDRAAALECEARSLRLQAVAERPLPARWRIGQTVRYIRTSDDGWTFTKDGLGLICGIDPNTKDRAPSEYVLFWTHPLNEDGEPNRSATWWTTSHDVELVV